jgi:acetoacetate decarboxylase
MVYTTLMETNGYWKRLSAMVAPPEGQWLYRDAHYLVAEVEIDPAAARRWVPWPLRPVVPTLATIFTAFFPDSSFGSVYREAGVFLHVEHHGTRAIHCPWMIVDDDVALIVGRELLGYPKKLGEISWQHEGDRVEGVASRRGAALIQMRAVLGDIVRDAPPILGRPHRNVRASMGISVPWLLSFTPREAPIEVRRAQLDLQVGGSARDPLHELACGDVRAAYLHRVNLGSPGVSSFPHPIGVASPRHYLRNLLLRTH